MGPAITWLHLSDLHACNPRAGWEARRILEELKDDLKRMQDRHGLHPDLIFFTGDAAYGHTGSGPGGRLADQFEVAGAFLEGVRTAFDPEVPREDVFLVPGNHDANRELPADDLIAWLDSEANAGRVADMIGGPGGDWQRYAQR